MTTTLAPAGAGIRKIALQLEQKFRVPGEVSIGYISDPRREAAARLSWREKADATGAGTNIAAVTRPAIEAVPRLLGERAEVRALEVGAGCNADRNSREKVTVTNPLSGKDEAIIVTEPWQLARELSKVSARFSLDILEVNPPVVSWIEKAKTHPPRGSNIPNDLYQRAISEKLHPILGDVLDLSLHEKLEGEYDLVVALGVLSGLGSGTDAERRDLAVTSFLLLLSHLKPDGVFITNSCEAEDFARKYSIPNHRWFVPECEGMPYSSRL